MLRQLLRRHASSFAHAIDDCGIPLKPTWSVNALLSSYPTPAISTTAFERLHKLSALTPPPQGSPEYETLKKELEELIRLVEAVRLVKPQESNSIAIPDGRIWAENEGLQFPSTDTHTETTDGTDLLKHAERQSEGMYVVDSSRTRQ